MPTQPDIDFLFFPGQHDALTPFAHRGITHSSITAIVVALVVGLVAKASTTSRARRVFVVVALVLASHGICDALGTRGRGVALVWLATSARFIHHLLAPAPFPPRPWTLGFWPLAAYELAFSLPFVVFSLVRQHPKQRRNRLSKPGD